MKFENLWHNGILDHDVAVVSDAVAAVVSEANMGSHFYFDSRSLFWGRIHNLPQRRCLVFLLERTISHKY